MPRSPQFRSGLSSRPSADRFNIALPTIARDLHVEPSAAVLIVTVYQLVLTMTLLPFSALGDRFGHSAGALATCIRGVGQTLGATVAATLLSLGVGTGSLPTLMSAALGIFAGICSLAVLNPATRRPVILAITEDLH